MDTIGERIEYARELCNMKQKDLAYAIGVTKATMSKYENNLNIPNAEILCRIAKELNTSADYLLGRTNSIRSHINDDTLEYSTENLFNLFLKLNDENKMRIFERALTLWEQQQH